MRTYFNSTQFYELLESNHKTKVKIAFHCSIKNQQIIMINKDQKLINLFNLELQKKMNKSRKIYNFCKDLLSKRKLSDSDLDLVLQWSLDLYFYRYLII